MKIWLVAVLKEAIAGGRDITGMQRVITTIILMKMRMEKRQRLAETLGVESDQIQIMSGPTLHRDQLQPVSSRSDGAISVIHLDRIPTAVKLFGVNKSSCLQSSW